jgi:hypothetical protein
MSACGYTNDENNSQSSLYSFSENNESSIKKKYYKKLWNKLVKKYIHYSQ